MKHGSSTSYPATHVARCSGLGDVEPNIRVVHPGNPAIVTALPKLSALRSCNLRPEALRPRLSTGLPSSTRVLPVVGNSYRCTKLRAIDNQRRRSRTVRAMERDGRVAAKQQKRRLLPATPLSCALARIGPEALRRRLSTVLPVASASRQQQFRLCNCRYSTTSR